jgi:hypothetical protein
MVSLVRLGLQKADQEIWVFFNWLCVISRLVYLVPCWASCPQCDAGALVGKRRGAGPIRDRLVDGRGSCWRCRKPIVVGQLRTVVSNGEGVARFHQECATVWLAEQEVAARRALGLAYCGSSTTLSRC